MQLGHRTAHPCRRRDPVGRRASSPSNAGHIRAEPCRQRRQAAIAGPRNGSRLGCRPQQRDLPAGRHPTQDPAGQTVGYRGGRSGDGDRQDEGEQQRRRGPGQHGARDAGKTARRTPPAPSPPPPAGSIATPAFPRTRNTHDERKAGLRPQAVAHRTRSQTSSSIANEPNAANVASVGLPMTLSPQGEHCRHHDRRSTRPPQRSEAAIARSQPSRARGRAADHSATPTLSPTSAGGPPRRRPLRPAAGSPGA